MKKTLFITLLGLCFCAFQGYAQDQSVPLSDFQKYKEKIPNAPLPPSAFSFQQFGSYPLSEYTGKVNISIPIFQISSGEINVPISISYSTGGIKVNQEASWVGLGWNLDFGGIYQQINDIDDFAGTEPLTNNTPGGFEKLRPDFSNSNPALIEKYPLVDAVSWSNNGIDGNTTFPIDPVANNSSLRLAYDYYIPINGLYTRSPSLFTSNFFDSEPDIFSANFFGHNLNFIFDMDTGLVKILNEEGYIIEYTETGDNDVNIRGLDFKITAPDGMVFYFNKDERIKRYKSVPIGGSFHNISSRVWKITRIEDTMGNYVDFNYTDIQNIKNMPNFSQTYAQTLASSMCSMTNNCIPHNSVLHNKEFDYMVYHSGVIYNAEVVNHTNTETYFDMTQQNYLVPSSITWNSGTVYFDTSSRIDRAGLTKLDKIRIHNGTKVVSTFDFDYSYFDSDTSYNNLLGTDLSSLNPMTEFTIDQKNKRLKLNKVTENIEKEHLFEYNSTLLPPKNSTAIDYWGYFNGHNNQSIIPEADYFDNTPNVLATGNNKNASLANARAASLNKIIYPTKGYTTFTYQLNTADNLVNGILNNAPTSGNGLRLFLQSDYSDQNEIAKTTQYEYEGGKSLAPLTLHQKYTVHNNQNFFVYSSQYGNYYRTTTVLELSSGNMTYPASFSAANDIGYSKVTTKTVHIGVTNGKEVKYFKNSPNFVTSIYGKSISLPTRKFQEITNGTLLKNEVYDNNDSLQTMDKYTYYYQSSPLDYGVKFANAGRILYHPLAIIDPIGYSKDFVGFYPIFSDKTMLKSKESFSYFDNDSTSILTTYGYDNLNRKTSETYANLSADSYTKATYSYQSGTDFINQNKLNSLSVVTKRNHTPVAGLQTIESVAYSYYKDIQTNYLLMDELSACSHGTDCRKTFFNKYDSDGNILEYKIEDGNSTVILWGYNKDLIIAKIENATFSEVATALGISETTLKFYNETNLSSINSLRSSLPNALVTTFTHDPLIGVLQVKDSRGYITSYQYDGSNRLEFVKDQDGNILSENKYHYKN
jgi:hypothetical protein